MYALITGASSGIGKASAFKLAEAGYQLILVARRTERLIQIQNEIKTLYPSIDVRVMRCDLTSKEQIELLTETLFSEISYLDILINNAGLALGVDKVQDANLNDWEKMLSTNVTGLFYLTRLVLPKMLEKQSGHIINIGSVAGRWTYPGGAVYCASKAAVKSFTEGLRLDLIGTSIRVTIIEPGMVETEFSEVRLKDKLKAKAVYENMTPLTGLDIANTILWCIQQPPHVNIQEIVIFPTDQAGVGYVHRKAPHL